MTSGRRFSKLVATIAVGAGLCLGAGCGDDSGLARRYSVSGTVTYQGKPLETGQITFTPAKPDDTTRAANGFIENGSYTLTTATPSDGALPGEYKVTISARLVDDAKVKETINKKGGGARQHEVAKAQAKSKAIVPAKYELPDTSGLTAKVEEKSNTFDFELKD